MLSPDQFERFSESSDFTTGYRHLMHDIELPDFREHNDPMSVRASAREHSRNSWLVQTTHGPFAEADEKGSYYRTKEQYVSASVTPGVMKKRLRSTARAEWRGLMKARGAQS